MRQTKPRAGADGRRRGSRRSAIARGRPAGRSRRPGVPKARSPGRRRCRRCESSTSAGLARIAVILFALTVVATSAGREGPAATLGALRRRRRDLRDPDGAAGGPHRHPSGSAASRAPEDLAGEGVRGRARRAALAGHPDHRHRVGDDRRRDDAVGHGAAEDRRRLASVDRHGDRDRRAGAGVRAARRPQRGRPHVSGLGAARESARARAGRDGAAAHHAWRDLAALGGHGAARRDRRRHRVVRAGDVLRAGRR